jgi:hypothetical protein
MRLETFCLCCELAIEAGEHKRIGEELVERRDIRIELSAPQASFERDDLGIIGAGEYGGKRCNV